MNRAKAWPFEVGLVHLASMIVTTKYQRPAMDDDTPHPSGRDRYALYSLRYEHGEPVRHRLCETSRDGIGTALISMIEEGEIQRGDSVGLFDRESRDWLINPWLALR